MSIAVYERSARVRGRAINVGSTERLASAVLGGTLLALGLRGEGIGKALLSVVGGGLLVRGVSGHCPVYGQLQQRSSAAHDAHALLPAPSEKLEHARTMTIGKPAADVFRVWQKPETQSRILAHFADVTGDASGRLQWHVRGPLGRVLSFETQRTEEREDALVAWQSTPGGELQSHWTLQLRKAPSDYGTEATLRVRFAPAGGVLPHMLTKLLGLPTQLIVERTLRNFKALIETGEIPSAFHNPSARAGARSDHQAPHALRGNPERR